MKPRWKIPPSGELKQIKQIVLIEYPCKPVDGDKLFQAVVLAGLPPAEERISALKSLITRVHHQARTVALRATHPQSRPDHGPYADRANVCRPSVAMSARLWTCADRRQSCGAKKEQRICARRVGLRSVSNQTGRTRENSKQHLCGARYARVWYGCPRLLPYKEEHR